MDLGSLLGGLADQEPQGNNSAQGGDEVLGSLSGNAGGGGDLGGLLGALMGGGGQGAQGGDAMMGMLGSLLGGGGQGAQGGDAMMGMLGGLLGGMGGASANTGAMNGADTGMNAALAPLADMLSEKLGLPREMAMAAMAVIVPMILSKLAGGGQSQGGDRSAGLSFSRNEQSEMIDSLSSQTGLTQEQSAQVLNQAMQVLGGQ